MLGVRRRRTDGRDGADGAEEKRRGKGKGKGALDLGPPKNGRFLPSLPLGPSRIEGGQKADLI